MELVFGRRVSRSDPVDGRRIFSFSVLFQPKKKPSDLGFLFSPVLISFYSGGCAQVPERAAPVASNVYQAVFAQFCQDLPDLDGLEVEQVRQFTTLRRLFTQLPKERLRLPSLPRWYRRSLANGRNGGRCI